MVQVAVVVTYGIVYVVTQQLMWMSFVLVSLSSWDHQFSFPIYFTIFMVVCVTMIADILPVS